jgi:predicted enzyme related to lactoylglutathione lyase
MQSVFVWFHNASDKAADAVKFYEKLLGWKSTEGPASMTMFVGDAGPFAGVAPKEGRVSGWIPYVEVDDVDASVKRAVKLGADVLQEKTRGPAGEFSVIRDPGGASVALWRKA